MTARQMEYAKFLESDQWQMLRQRCYQLADWKCCKCGVRGLEVHAHHRLYRARFEDTRQDDLECVCFICHAKLHNREPVLDVAVPLPKPVEIKTLLDATIARKKGIINRDEYRRHKKAFQERNSMPRMSRKRRKRLLKALGKSRWI